VWRFVGQDSCPSAFTAVHGTVDDVAVTDKCPLPEGVQLVSQRRDGNWIQPVDPSGPGRRFVDQAGVLEDLQMLGDRGPGDRQSGGELSNGHRLVGEACDDGAPRAIGQRAPSITISVSIH
jgi:hypothetical protein